MRSKAYASFGYYNLRDYGLADKKAAIEALAARHSVHRHRRSVGIYGHSGGGFMSAAAVLQKPYNEFFKAAVASAGNHDNNIYGYTWAERYHGLKEVAAKTETAAKDSARTASAPEIHTPAAPPPKKVVPPVKGEAKRRRRRRRSSRSRCRPTRSWRPTSRADCCWSTARSTTTSIPANTLRLVDALIRANKRFDMLILPGKRHAFADYTPYFTQRMWEFFAEHLQGDRRTGADLSDTEGE